MALRTLSLCSGVGGLDLGFELAISRLGIGGSRVVAYVEGEAFCAANLVGAMEAGSLDQAPIWSDLRTFDARPWRDVVDCVIGGYPCQPFSVAGKGLGEKDPRHLWPHVARILRECEPRIAFFENVPGHVARGGHEVVSELQGMGYSVAATLWTAEEIGAPHKRERLFILAVADPEGLPKREPYNQAGGEPRDHTREAPRGGGMRARPIMADPDDARSQGRGVRRRRRPHKRIAGEGRGEVADPDHSGRDKGNGDLQAGKLHAERVGLPQWPPGPDDMLAWGRVPMDAQPAVCRVAYRMAARVDRLRATGNGVVPQQAAAAFLELYDALANRSRGPVRSEPSSVDLDSLFDL